MFTSTLSAPPLPAGHYANPVIPGFNPDPTICRVGGDYYVVTSSFEYFPGAPIYHSRDLVNWRLIGHALHRPSQLALDGAACSAGIYAPTLRHHDGVFYLVTTLAGVLVEGAQRGNFIVTATDPAGPWSEPHWIANAPGIDPSLLFDDDGRAWMHGNFRPAVMRFPAHRDIWVQELDLQTWTLIGERHALLDGAEYYRSGTLDGGAETGVNNYEAPHLYKKDGAYYLVIAHGGTAHHHAVSLWKSERITGPYRPNPANPVLTHRDLPAEHPLTTTGHADFVQTPGGDWWIIYLGKRPLDGRARHVLGRETFLTPMDWTGEWPVVNPHGQRGRGELSHALPALPPAPFPPAPMRDEFDGPALDLRWQFLRTPRTQWWSLSEAPGYLRLHLQPETVDEHSTSACLVRRQEHPHCVATLRLRFAPTAGSEEAGLVVLRNKDKHLVFVVARSGDRDVVRLRVTGGAASGSVTVEAPASGGGGDRFLRVEASGVWYRFSYSANGVDWCPCGEPVDASFLGDDEHLFTGTVLGPYATSNGAPSAAHADFAWFEYSSR